MPVKIKLLFNVLFLLFSSFIAFADIGINVPIAVVEGNPFAVVISVRNDVDEFSVSVFDGDNKLVSSPLFPLPGLGNLYYAILSVPYGYNIKGKDVFVIFYKNSVPFVKRSIPFFSQSYRKESIELNQNLSSIRQDDSKKRQLESLKLYKLITSYIDYHGGLGDIWFLPVGGGHFSSYFGDIREFLYSDGEKAYSRHSGVDIAAPEGTDVVLPVSGRVMLAEERIVTGKTIVICHAPGVYSLYYHLNNIFVDLGDEVSAGTIIGTVGSTGLSTGPHLHWELRVSGVPSNPFFLMGSSLLDIIKNVIKM